MTMHIPQFDTSHFCNFIEIEEALWECSKCKQRIGGIGNQTIPPILPCKTSVAKYAEKFSQKNDEISTMISQRYEICKVCEFFKKDICTKCGCMVSVVDNHINKLSDKKDKCPEGKW